MITARARVVVSLTVLIKPECRVRHFLLWGVVSARYDCQWRRKNPLRGLERDAREVELQLVADSENESRT